MTIDEIKKLVTVVQETGIAELELHLGEDRVRIVNMQPTKPDVVLPTVMPVSLASAPMQTIGLHSLPEPVPANPVPPVLPEKDQDNIVVKSPIVGTYYDSPAPGVPPFVKVGDQVEAKQVLCIIESMKLMNEIEADLAGEIVGKHVENGRPIEYGETLFTIRPL